MRPSRCLLLVFVAVALVLASCSSSTTSAPLPVVTYHGNGARTGYTTDSTITPANVASLSERWHVSVATSISNQPIVDGNTVYWGDWKGDMHATTVSGTSLWSTFVGTAPKPAACPYPLATQGVVSTPTVGTVGGQNLVWVGGGAGQMMALDASTGAVVWSTLLGTPPEHEVWASPLLYDGSVYVGVASWNDCPVVNGEVARLNAATGAVQAVSRLDPSPKCIGPGMWSSASVDPTTNSIYVTTSNANLKSNPSATCQLPEQEAVLELNAKTLTTESAWALPAVQQVGDSDFGASPMLFSGDVGGRQEQLVGALNKNGVFYAFDRDDLSAGPIWIYTAESTSLAEGAGTGSTCEDVNTIASSAWAGPGSPVIVPGLAASGSSCVGTLAALDPATGQPEWKVSLQGPILGAVTEVPGLVAVGAGSHVDVLSSSSGAQLFTYAEPVPATKTKKTVYGAPVGYFWSPITIAGNSLYASNQDGTLRAFSP